MLKSKSDVFYLQTQFLAKENKNINIIGLLFYTYFSISIQTYLVSVM